MDESIFSKNTQWWKINKFFVSFSIYKFFLLTTTNELINQKNSSEENNKFLTIPLLSKEKSLALFSFLNLYADKFKNKNILMCQQIHGNNVIYANQPDMECLSGNLQINNLVFPYKVFLQTDGIITDSLQDLIVIFTADCIPLFIVNNKNNLFGLVHMGRKGLQNGIVKSLLIKLSSLPYYSLNDTIFIAGPHICEKCYIVDGKNFSLFDLLREQLICANIKPSQILNSGFCTFHNKSFFSYKRDATQFRMLSVISIL